MKIGNWKFSLRSLYKTLPTQNHTSIPVKPIWKTRVPPKIVFFGWTAAADLGKVLMLDNKRKKNCRNGMMLCVRRMERRVLFSKHLYKTS